MPSAPISRIQNGRRRFVNSCISSILSVTSRKYLKGVAAFQRHMGVLPQSSHSHTLTRRTAGVDPLTDDGNERWQGTISVGSPAVEYKGELLVDPITQ